MLEKQGPAGCTCATAGPAPINTIGDFTDSRHGGNATPACLNCDTPLTASDLHRGVCPGCVPWLNAMTQALVTELGGDGHG